MTGYGTNLRPKKLLKNGEAAKIYLNMKLIFKVVLGHKIVLMKTKSGILRTQCPVQFTDKNFRTQLQKNRQIDL